jgi:hypothetical protein
VFLHISGLILTGGWHVRRCCPPDRRLARECEDPAAVALFGGVAP